MMNPLCTHTPEPQIKYMSTRLVSFSVQWLCVTCACISQLIETQRNVHPDIAIRLFVSKPAACTSVMPTSSHDKAVAAFTGC